MARPSNWNSQTTSIRVPAHTVDRLLELARLLDSPSSEGFVQNLDPIMVTVQNQATIQQYLIQPEPVTAAEDAKVSALADGLIAQLQKAGMRKADAIAYAVAKIAEQVGQKIG
jgi:predicted transcriptional regulator